MPRPREFDPDLVLDRATELFWSKGYEGTSISDLEEYLGVGRQSLYGAFGDKHELYVKAMDRYGASQSGARLALLKPGAAAREIREYFVALVTHLTTEPRKSCMLINAALETGTEDPAVAARISDNQLNLTRAFRNAVAGAVAKGELDRKTDTHALALALVSQSFGLNIMARNGATAATLQKVVETTLQPFK
jgi:TetR/AcrR family transcriptional repressor of nem operon